MAFVGDLGTANPGETFTYAFSFANRLATGETLSNPVAAIGLWTLSPVVDPDASEIAVTTPVISGSTVSCTCGGASPPFVAGAVYSFGVEVTTSGGKTLIGWGNITCLPDPLTFNSASPTTTVIGVGNTGVVTPGDIL